MSDPNASNLNNPMDSCRDRPQHHVEKSPQKAAPPSSIPLPEPLEIPAPDISFLFNPIRDDLKPYHLDGDTTMYTETSIARRNSLKSDSLVIEGINDFMTLYTFDSSNSLNRKEYERMYWKICNVLRVSLDPTEYKKMLDEEWKKDSKGYEVMSRVMVFDCLFELCDIWCPNINPGEYKAFFDQLKFRIRYEGQKNSAAYDILK